MKSGKAGSSFGVTIACLGPIACFAESRNHCSVMQLITLHPPLHALTKAQGGFLRLWQAVLRVQLK